RKNRGGTTAIAEKRPQKRHGRLKNLRKTGIFAVNGYFLTTHQSTCVAAFAIHLGGGPVVQRLVQPLAVVRNCPERGTGHLNFRGPVPLSGQFLKAKVLGRTPCSRSVGWVTSALGVGVVASRIQEKPNMAISARSDSVAQRLLPILGW